MGQPAFGLENRKPIDLLASAAGAETVQDHLTMLEYGIYM
ncbi:antitoxin Xre/MbcA/ParS toxin-binding domain-containing protein [Celeribacter halophilus]|uniref:Putative toxin-antitoxin system antitoxin component, TIGR02293 family n=1 Tax=Celeribacter halophilus TaxID=576117 RepID=A0A1I3XEP8_9RHOB|nr:putative toxin-antitoxin system antitoxin component (TIGR02293 family) [Celeribacter halophilus]SFK17561.1 putative toxin-antitoxin system antitoxin component, TIGR02293 family [Celeribacter halophilus]